MVVVEEVELRPDVQWMVCLRIQLSEKRKRKRGKNSRVKITASNTNIFHFFMYRAQFILQTKIARTMWKHFD
jgi:hypothetical protein